MHIKPQSWRKQRLKTNGRVSLTSTMHRTVTATWPFGTFPVLHRTKRRVPRQLLPLLCENAFANRDPVHINQIRRKEKIFVSLFALTPSKDESKLNFSVKGCSPESRHDNALISITMFSFVCLKRAVFLIDGTQLIPSESRVNSGVRSPVGSFHFLSHLHATLSLYSNWFFWMWWWQYLRMLLSLLLPCQCQTRWLTK